MNLSVSNDCFYFNEEGSLFFIPKEVLGKGGHVEIEQNILGSNELQFDISVQTAKIEVASSWKSPNFYGRVLPINRIVNDEGFNATWEISSSGATSESFGVKLMVSVDNYRLTDRATKYAFLFIALTFIAFFIAETVNKWRIHPVQYFLIGAAMAIFYSLLLSFSEHIAFGYSYLISSIATISLISWYTLTILRKNHKSALRIIFLLVILYMFMYFILQMEDYALMAGSILLFVMIGISMYCLRNVDWYKEQQ